MLRHIMMVDCKAGCTPAHLERIAAEYLKLPEHIQGFAHIEWGVDENSETGQKTLCLLFIFGSEKDKQYCLTHPRFIALNEHVKPAACKMTSLQYKPRFQ